MLRLTEPAWYKATITGTVHPFYSDAFLIVPPPQDRIAPQRAHRLINTLTLEFLDRYLRGESAAPVLEYAVELEDLNLVTKQGEAD